MTPSEVGPARTVVRSRAEVIRARHRRQTYTFVTLFSLVLLVGLVALGNWQQWWTIGGSAQAAATTCPESTVTDPELTNVSVFNGTDRKGLAAAVAKELQKRRFRVLTIDNEEQSKPIKAVVQVRYGAAGERAARTVALQFPAKVKMIADKRDSEAVDVVIGEKYKTMVSARKGAAAIAPKPRPRGCVAATTPPADPGTNASS